MSIPAPASQSLPRMKRNARRTGKVLAFFVVLLPAMLGVLGLVIDGGVIISSARDLQSVADAAATAAAKRYQLTGDVAEATACAQEVVAADNLLSEANVTVHIPPATGPYAGIDGFAEVIVTNKTRTHIIQVLGLSNIQTQSSRAVAGVEDATADAAIVILDPHPDELDLAPVPTLLLSPAGLLGSLEVLGVGRVRVDGAILNNSELGGVDEDGNPAGDSVGPPYALAAMPLLPLTSLTARDIRVVGGVDQPSRYGNFVNGESSPLRANRLSVPDPFRDLPVPTVASDGANVSDTEYGGVTVVGLPLIGPPTILQPGVYEWINVVSGRVVFQPGIYVIRSVHPVTQLALSLAAGQITAEGVMFYITNSAAYSTQTGLPDALDGETEPPDSFLGQILPSVAINASLLNSTFSPLADPGSPFDGIFLYQRRQDRRMIALSYVGILLGGDNLAGTVYAKWGHVAMVGQGTIGTRIVAGTARFITVATTTVQPSNLLPPARDVYLVE